MSKFSSFGVFILAALFGIVAGPIWAQDKQAQATTPPAAPAQSVAPAQTPPSPDPKFLEDGGFSIEPLYWINKKQPTIYGGKTATAYDTFNYAGNAKDAPGAEIGIPAGRANTLRISYFRVQGNANATLGQNTTIFTEAYSTSDYLAANYTIQSAKVSWDYLSYTWHKPTIDIHLKTLYEVQYVNVKTAFAAPLKAVTTDASGNTNGNTATGSKSMVYPTLGMALGSALGKHFRWEIRGSGFGIPHRAVIWDTQATIAFRIGAVEILAMSSSATLW
jgi:hypothetical protein